MLLDTHCHLHLMARNFQDSDVFAPLNSQEIATIQQALEDAKKQHVTKIVNIGTNWSESLTCIEMAKQFDNCWATIGLHPNDAQDNWQDVMEKFDDLLQHAQTNKIVGIGECGIDKHYPEFNLKRQEGAFHAQIQLALKYNLALVIHSRDADQDTYNALQQYRGEKNFRGTIHCFSSDENYAQKYMDLGFVLGFGGTVTYPKNETLRNVAKMVPLSSIVLETDAPFLPPQTMRGKKNHPANIYVIAQYLAQLRGESLEHVMQVTTQTASELFNIA